jgi:TFIIF-interacting CTD phosphatase-like protein
MPKTMRRTETDLTLVLDLDETCLHTLTVNEDEGAALKTIEDLGIDKIDEYEDLGNRLIKVGLDDPVSAKGTGIRHGCISIARPHLYPFLIFAFSYFKYVVVWSAGVDTYVRKLARMITRYTPNFDLVLTRDDCIFENGEYVKPLSKMIKEHHEFGFDITKILIVDDRDSTYVHNPRNGVMIPIYKPSVTISSMRADDDNLIRFKLWIVSSNLSSYPDVRDIDKYRIFLKSPAEYNEQRKSRVI